MLHGKMHEYVNIVSVRRETRDPSCNIAESECQWTEGDQGISFEFSCLATREEGHPGKIRTCTSRVAHSEADEVASDKFISHM